MNNKQALNEYVELTGLRLNTVSFYTDENESEDLEAYFGTCDITGIQGMIVPCIGLDKDDNIISFEAGEWLVGGVLGKAAGAF